MLYPPALGLTISPKVEPLGAPGMSEEVCVVSTAFGKDPEPPKFKILPPEPSGASSIRVFTHNEVVVKYLTLFVEVEFVGFPKTAVPRGTLLQSVIGDEVEL